MQRCEKCGNPRGMRFLAPDLGRFVHLCAKCWKASNK